MDSILQEIKNNATRESTLELQNKNEFELIGDILRK